MINGMTLSSSIAKHSHDDAHLNCFLHMLPKLGLKSRKAILDHCQTEKDAYEDESMIRVAAEIRKDFQIRTLRSSPSKA